MLDRWFPGKQDWAPLLLRIPLGVIFFAHGAQKVLGWFGGYGWNATLQYFTQNLHIPVALAVAAFLAEFLGGIAVFFGILTRWAALVVAGEMVIATVKVHLPNGFFLNWANTPKVGHGIEYNLMLIGALLALIVTGGGRLSVDAALKKEPAPRGESRDR